MVNDISMMDGKRENENEDEEMEIDSFNNLSGALNFHYVIVCFVFISQIK
jgi:hypothetical protein